MAPMARCICRRSTRRRPTRRRPLTDALRLGRATDWQEAGAGGPTVGLGAVTILVGEEALTWLEMDKVTFQVAS